MVCIKSWSCCLYNKIEVFKFCSFRFVLSLLVFMLLNKEKVQHRCILPILRTRMEHVKFMEWQII